MLEFSQLSSVFLCGVLLCENDDDKSNATQAFLECNQNRPLSLSCSSQRMVLLKGQRINNTNMSLLS